MQHTALHNAALAKLSSRDAAWLTDTFARNKTRFGGWSMKEGEGDDKPADTPGGDKPKDEPKPDDKPAEDKPLGEGGEKALKAEREARKQFEGQLADLKKNLAAAFGAQPEDDGKKDTADTLAAVQQQIADMKHENNVLALANEHRITDKDDLALLRATKDADALTKLAARLAKPVDSDELGRGKRRPGTPRPDGSQGRGSEDAKASVAAGRDLFAARRGKKSA